MATITLEIQDGLLLKALASAAAKKLTLEEHLEEVLREAEEEEGDESQGFTDLHSAIAQALERAAAQPKGKPFQLQDLFTDEEWASIPTPKWFGRKFRPAVEKAGIAKFQTKTQTNKAIYQRI